MPAVLVERTEVSRRTGACRSKTSPRMAGRMPGLGVRRLTPDDFPHVVRELDQWSRGRFLATGLHRAFFRHFADTSLLLHEGAALAGFLIGYRSQREPTVACVHHVVVGPKWRRCGGEEMLYSEFLDLAAASGCREVQAAISPANSAMILFHRQLGFDVAESDGCSLGIAVCRDYAGPGQHRVLFSRKI